MDAQTYDLLRQAEMFESQNRPERAIPLLRKAIGRDPECAIAYSMLAHALRREGKFEEATDCARRRVQLRPNDALSHYRLAEMFVASEQYAEAIESGSEAIRLDPSNAYLHWPVANGYIGLKRYAESIAVSRTGLSINPAQIQLQHHLGLALAADGQTDEAIRVTQAYLTDASHESMSQTVAGWSYWHLGRLDEAAVHFQEALRIDPKFPWQHEGLGIVRYDQGRWIEAREILNEAARLDSAMKKGRIVLAELERRIVDHPDPPYPTSDSRGI